MVDAVNMKWIRFQNHWADEMGIIYYFRQQGKQTTEEQNFKWESN